MIVAPYSALSSVAPPPTPCPPPPPGPPPPPAPVPPGPARDFSGHRFGHTTGTWWRAGDHLTLRLGTRIGSGDGYGTWSEAVDAAAAASAGAAGAIAVCDDRGRLYLYSVSAGCVLGAHPLRLGERHEVGYAFRDDVVRGLVDGDLVASRGDCLHRWIPLPALPPG
ncbi:MAG: hypothetical protein JWM98_1044 [Thermoleophilia bacterium]|nr:hypothetical protein [Thermoleophilia bacterium]